MSKTGTRAQATVQQPIQAEQEPKAQKKKQPLLILRLKDRPRVTWTEDTVDNENMNKKKSNLCCIYHRPGESSSDTCTSDDEGNALQRDRHTKHLHKKKCSKHRKKELNKNSKGDKD